MPTRSLSFVDWILLSMGPAVDDDDDDSPDEEELEDLLGVGLQATLMQLRNPLHTPDVSGRFTDTAWCSCENCTVKPTVEESRCCHELPELQKFLQNGIKCVTHHPDFTKSVIQREYLVELLAFATYLTQKQFDRHAERYCRLAAFRLFLTKVHGFMEKDERYPIPSCVITKIWETFPDPSGASTGWNW